MGNFINRTGEESYNTYGCKMKIIEYNRYNSIKIQFQDEFKEIVDSSYKEFKNGKIKNPNDKTVLGIGIVGRNNTMEDKTHHKKSYVAWRAMLVRCYDENSLKIRPTYKDCVVSEKWFKYENFEKWWNLNYYDCDSETMCLDKDILIKGNKIYSEHTCIIVPQKINKLFTKRNIERGDTPIGVSKYNDIYLANCSSGKRDSCIYGGRHKTKEGAFLSYKEIKETHIKKVADEYKNKYPNFPKRLYDAMYKYEVEITD